MPRHNELQSFFCRTTFLCSCFCSCFCPCAGAGNILPLILDSTGCRRDWPARSFCPDCSRGQIFRRQLGGPVHTSLAQSNAKDFGFDCLTYTGQLNPKCFAFCFRPCASARVCSNLEIEKSRRGFQWIVATFFRQVQASTGLCTVESKIFCCARDHFVRFSVFS